MKLASQINNYTQFYHGESKEKKNTALRFTYFILNIIPYFTNGSVKMIYLNGKFPQTARETYV